MYRIYLWFFSGLTISFTINNELNLYNLGFKLLEKVIFEHQVRKLNQLKTLNYKLKNHYLIRKVIISYLYFQIK